MSMTRPEREMLIRTYEALRAILIAAESGNANTMLAEAAAQRAVLDGLVELGDDPSPEMPTVVETRRVRLVP